MSLADLAIPADQTPMAGAPSILVCTRALPESLPRILQSSHARKSARLSPSCKAGLRYEEKVISHFSTQTEIEAKPWFQYKKKNDKLRFMQPDCLLLLPDRKVVVVEVKLRAVRAGFLKLRNLYVPALEKYFGPEYSLTGLLVCHWFEPKENVGFPPVPHPLDMQTKWGFHIWNPRYER